MGKPSIHFENWSKDSESYCMEVKSKMHLSRRHLLSMSEVTSGLRRMWSI